MCPLCELREFLCDCDPAELAAYYRRELTAAEDREEYLRSEIGANAEELGGLISELSRLKTDLEKLRDSE